MNLSIITAALIAASWQHPSGLVTDRTIEEVGYKLESQAWARTVYEKKKADIDKWMEVSSEVLSEVFPTRRSNVYHNFSCPTDRSRLVFDPFQNKKFVCPTCGSSYAPDFDAGIYEKGDKYHGTVYDGWACLFYQTAADVASDLGLFARIESDERYARRGIEILQLFARALRNTPTDRLGQGQEARILRYNREGDSNVLCDLAVAHELLRFSMKEDERKEIERDVLQRMLEDGMLEPFYTRTPTTTFSSGTERLCKLGLGSWKTRRSSTGVSVLGNLPWKTSPNTGASAGLSRIFSNRMAPIGGFVRDTTSIPFTLFVSLPFSPGTFRQWTRNVFQRQTMISPPPENPAGETIKSAIEWFLSLAMPDRTMSTVGDSMVPRAGMDDYYMTAEVGYRYFDVAGIGDYKKLREGKRVWAGLLYGSPEIVPRPTSFTSSYLSSGWVSLRNEWNGNRVWVGLNALQPGSGHQHADRLNLVHYSQGELLSLEKATPYNEQVTRVLGTQSQSHNTVTVDGASQKKGDRLEGKEIPSVKYFFTCPIVQFAEIHADSIYPQTEVYRRSVALVEDIVIDFFEVKGGEMHDWMVHHSGEPPELSFEMSDATFEPVDWMANGSGRVQVGRADSNWFAHWIVNDVTSRLTMLGAISSDVYCLETYPVTHAFVTPEHPPCQTLCVRRANQSPYLAVWDAWKESPNLQSVAIGFDSERSLAFKTGSHSYVALFGPGSAEMEGGITVTSDGAFFLLRDGDAAVLIGGQSAMVKTPKGDLEISTDAKASGSVFWSDGTTSSIISGDIQYDTYVGQDHPRPAPKVTPAARGSLWGKRVRWMP